MTVFIFTYFLIATGRRVNAYPIASRNNLSQRIVMSNTNNSTQTDLIEINGDKVSASSLVVAKEFGKKHKDVLRKIDDSFKSTNQEVLEFTRRNFTLSEYKDSSGKSNKTYLMTDRGFSELSMGFTGEKAKLVRIRFIDAFEKAIKEIQRLREQSLSIDWQEARTKGKEIRTVLTDAIKSYEQHADRQGGWVKNKKTGEPTKPENRRYYSLVSSEIYAQLFTDRKLKKIRNKLDVLQLQFLMICESACADEIKKLVDLDTEYHEIYQAAKKRLTETVDALSLTRLSSYGINQVRLKWESKEPSANYIANGSLSK